MAVKVVASKFWSDGKARSFSYRRQRGAEMTTNAPLTANTHTASKVESADGLAGIFNGGVSLRNLHFVRRLSPKDLDPLLVSFNRRH